MSEARSISLSERQPDEYLGLGKEFRFPFLQAATS